MFRVLLTGPAGSGKGTIAKMLLKEFNEFSYFSSGDFIRDQVARGTVFGLRSQPFINKGEHIPDALLNGMLLSEVQKAGDKVIIDGYPRSLNQVKQIEESCPLNLVVQLKVPRKVLIERLSKQLVHPASGRTYNTEFNPPLADGKDDVTGEPLFQSTDDAKEVVRRRLEVHEKTESKVAEYYKRQGILLAVPGETSAAVFQVICDAINDNLHKKRTANAA